MKRASVSHEELGHLLVNGKRRIVSFIPVDKFDCDCFASRSDWAEKISKMKVEDRKIMQSQGKVFDCPRAKGKKKFAIYCTCGDLLAYVHADDDNLTNWCNLHYITESRIDEEKEERFEVVKYKRGPKKGQPKMENGKPVLEKIIEKKKYGRWHGAMAVNINGEKPVLECSCGNRLKLGEYKVKEV